VGEIPAPELLSAMADDPAGPRPSTMDDAVAAVAGAVTPAVAVAAGEDPGDDFRAGLARLADEAAPAGVRLILLGRGLLGAGPVPELVERLRHTTDLTVFDLDSGEPPVRPPS